VREGAGAVLSGCTALKDEEPVEPPTIRRAPGLLHAVLPHEGEAEDDGVADQDQPVCGPSVWPERKPRASEAWWKLGSAWAADWSACGIWLTGLKRPPK